MKNLKKVLKMSVMFLLVVVLTSCSGISQKSMYTGNIMGIEVQVVAEHKGNKLLKIDAEAEIAKEYFEMLTSIAGSEYVPANENAEMEDDGMENLSLVLSAFNNFSFKMLNGMEFNVSSINAKVLVNTKVDYDKVDMDTFKKILEKSPDATKLLKDFDNSRDFENFEKELLKNGLTKKY